MLGIYFALDDKPILSLICIAVSFAFKLQAVFIMPIYIVFLLSKRMKLWHILIFPATYLVIVSPALFLGRPLIETVALYIDQAGSVGSGLNYNSPSIFSFGWSGINENILAQLGIFASFAFMTSLLYWCFAGAAE